ncbi:MAG: DUF927 domain-containing protein [Proteobacteria bacterium]|nr:DUF927 domain-containing protein [Pseudomonadota bacterium]
MKRKRTSGNASTSTSHRQVKKGRRDISGAGRRKRVSHSARSSGLTKKAFRALCIRAQNVLKAQQEERLGSEFHPFASRKFPKGTPLPGVEGVQFAGVGVGAAGERFVRLLVGEGKHIQLLTVSAGELAAQPAGVFRKIANAGGRTLTQASKNVLTKAIEAKLGDEPSFYVAEQPGWHVGHKAFVLPYGAIGKAGRDIVFAPSLKSDGYCAKFRAVGSSRRWRRRVGGLLRGNSLAITACAAMLLSPILGLLGEENFILVLVGPPGSGRSTVIVVSSSQWGAHASRDRAMKLGCAETAKRTLADFDYPAIAHNDLGFAVDDLRSFRTSGSRAVAIEDLIKGLVEGDERGRATTSDKPATFRAVTVVSSNKSLQQEAVGSTYEADRAMLDRAPEVSLPAPNQAFEDLHGYPSLGAFCTALKEAALKDAGSVSLDFLLQLHAWVQCDRKECIAWLRARAAWFIAKYSAAGTPERALRRFALIYAAGCLAIRFGLHPWTRKELAAAIAKSLAGHVQLTVLNAPGGVADKASKASRLLAVLREWHSANRHLLRPAGINSGMSAADRAIRAMPGFTYEHPRRGPEVLMWEDAFGALVQHICAPDQAKRLLLEAEMIAIDESHNRRSFSVKRPLGCTADGGKWRPNMIALSVSAFDASLARTSAQ